MSGTEVLEEVNQSAAPSRPVESQETSLLSLLIVIAKRKRLILKVTAAGTIAAVLLSVYLPNQYTAETKLLTPQPRDSMASLLIQPLASLGGLGSIRGLSSSALGLTDPNAMYISILKSRTVADRLIDKFDLQNVYRKELRQDTRRALDKATDIDSSKDGSITIQVTDRDRNRAAAIANAYVKEFQLITDHLALTEAAQRRVYFERELDKNKVELEKAELALKGAQESTGMLQLDSQAKSIIEAIVDLKAQVAAKEVEINTMSTFAAPGNPDLILAKQQLAALRAQLDKAEHGSVRGRGDVLVPTGAIPKAGLEYADRLRDVKYYEEIFKVLATQYEAAKADEGRTAMIVQVLDVALPPERKSKPHRALIIIFIALLSFGGAVLTAFTLEAVEQLRNDPLRQNELSTLKRLLFSSKHRIPFVSDSSQ